MGALADSVVAYARPLFDATDGSPAQMQKAMVLAQICWNLALMSDEERDLALRETRSASGMNEEEFAAFRQSVVLPMIRRHREMFPHMPRSGSVIRAGAPTEPQTVPAPAVRAERYPGTARNAPCPCNSGKKYKRCCGR